MKYTVMAEEYRILEQAVGAVHLLSTAHINHVFCQNPCSVPIYYKRNNIEQRLLLLILLLFFLFFFV